MTNQTKNSKVLIFDIETSPNIAYVWGAWKQNISSKQFLEKSYIMSFAAKWLGGEEVFYVENRHNNDKELVTSLYKLLDEAEVVVAHNGKKFDLPKVLGRGLVHGLKPPSPYHTVDTLLVARKRFGFVSNRLADLCHELGLTEKDEHKNFAGFDLWLQCLKQNDAAWAEMKHYNIQDVYALEDLYKRMLPYIDNHPNMGVGICSCGNCGSTNMQKRGTYKTKAGLTYQRYVCSSCGSWSRDKTKEAGGNNLRVAFNG